MKPLRRILKAIKRRVVEVRMNATDKQLELALKALRDFEEAEKKSVNDLNFLNAKQESRDHEKSNT